jgi:cysteine desulfurase
MPFVSSEREGGRVDAAAILRAVRAETLLVSVMHVNNETGVIQPIDEIASGLQASAAFLHVDCDGRRIRQPTGI